MIKMETTEPTVELKLKKGGAVKKMARGGAPMGAMVGAPKGGVMAGAAPKMPALAARRRAMKAMGAAPAAPIGPAAAMMGMKKGGKADMAQDKAMLKKAFMQHDTQEHKGGKGTKLKLKSGGMAGKMERFETKTTIEGNEGQFKKTKMHEAKPDRVKGPTGMIKEKNAGGYKTGGVVKGAGGFKTGGVVEGQGGFRKGGAIKKFAEGGRVQHDGGPEQMKQGKKKPAGPVSINSLAGTYKKGGAVMMATGGSAVKPPVQPTAEGHARAALSASLAASQKHSQMRSQQEANRVASKNARAELSASWSTEVLRESIAAAKRSSAAKDLGPFVVSSAPPKKAASVPPQRAEIQWTGPTGQGTINEDGSYGGRNPNIRVSQTPAPTRPPRPQPIPIPSEDLGARPLPVPVPRVENSDYRRGGRVKR